MIDKLKEQYTQVGEILERQYINVLSRKIDMHIAFLKSCEGHMNTLQSLGKQGHLIKEYLLISEYKDKIRRSIQEEYYKPVTSDFDSVFKEFNESMNQHIETLDEFHILIQKDERFHSQPNDSFIIKVAKRLKLIFLKVSRAPLVFTNLFRKLFKKPVKVIDNWTHKIGFRNLTAYYLKEQLSVSLLPMVSEVFELLCKTTKITWYVDEAFDSALDSYIKKAEEIGFEDIIGNKIQSAISELYDLKKSLADKSRTVLSKVYGEYETSYFLVGTIELGNIRFSQLKIIKKHNRLNKIYASAFDNWYNTLLALKEDWDIDLELYKTIYAAKRGYHQIYENMSSKVNCCLKEHLGALKQYFIACKHRVEKVTTKGLRLLIEEELNLLQSHNYLSILDKASDAILDQEFPKLLDDLESKVSTLVSQVSDKRAIVKGSDYEKPIKSSAISYISPKELINFEPLPQFELVVKKVKIEIANSINDVQVEIKGLHEIAKFNLESALTLFENKEKEDSPFDVAIEGMDRTIDKVEKLSKPFEEFKDLLENDLLAGLNGFAGSLIKLTDNENIYEIRIRIAKGKAIQRSKLWRERILKRFKTIIPRAVRYVTLRYRFAHRFVNRVFKQYGLTAHTDTISTELADFLAETEQAVERLPFVYRRLFKAAPLTDHSLFEGRKEEVRILTNAYNNWMKERFASTLIIGEKGSGVTSLINIFLQDLSTSCKIVRFSPPQALETPKELISIMSRELSHDFKDMNDLINYLLKGSKKVMVIENMQLLFLKKVGGFRSIQKLMELISLTHKKVFWIMSCTTYTWDYLNKTMTLSDHFSYLVKMKDFDNDTIIDIITKRHKISGYDVKFELPARNLNNKKFKKLSEKEQQSALRKEFFNDLNKIAKSNVSLGLIYWMRSTREVSGNTLSIGSLKDIDFGFMSNLSTNKIYSLTELLLHDGLTENEYCEITNQSLGKARATLNPLHEDGIITLTDDVYRINPLLYRQAINSLKAKNVIH